MSAQPLLLPGQTRPDEEELAEWGSTGEDHLFLSETRQTLTKNGIEMLFKRLKARAGIVGKRISLHIFRHTFAMNYLLKSNDPFKNGGTYAQERVSGQVDG